MRYDRKRCLVEISTEKAIIGNIRGVSGNDLHFFCFTDGRGSWTMSSSSQNVPAQILEADFPNSIVRDAVPLCNQMEGFDPAGNGGNDVEMHQHYRPLAPNRPELHYLDHVCQSLFVETMPACNSSLEFDTNDASNTASVCKLSIGDRTDRLLCDFFSDYGRGHVRVTVPAAVEMPLAVRTAALSCDGSDCSQIHWMPAQKEPFPAVGQLFVDCQPIDCDYIPMASDIDAVADTVPAEAIPDPALSLLQCRCWRLGRIPRSGVGIEARIATIDMLMPGRTVSSEDKESLVVCLDCGRVH